MGSPANTFDFERDWPGLRVQIQKSLAGWRVPAWLEEDILQETGAKIWDLRAEIDPSRSVNGLAVTIAINLLKDHLRRERFLARGTEMPIQAVPQDVENEVIARDEWRRVSSALSKLNPAHRAALIAAMFSDGRDRTPAAVRMMKMRARKQLRFLIEEVTKAKAGCAAALHHSWEAMARGLGLRSSHAPHLAQLAGAAVIAVTAGTGALSLPLADGPSGKTPGISRPVSKASIQLPGSGDSGPSDWQREIRLLSEAQGAKSKEARDRAQKFFRIGPLAYGPGDSVGSGTVMFNPNRIARKPGLGISTRDLTCRVNVLGKCKERKKR